MITKKEIEEKCGMYGRVMDADTEGCIDLLIEIRDLLIEGRKMPKGANEDD